MKNPKFEIDDKTFFEALSSFTPEDPKISKRREMITKGLVISIFTTLVIGLLTRNYKMFSDIMLASSFIIFWIWRLRKQSL